VQLDCQNSPECVSGVVSFIMVKRMTLKLRSIEMALLKQWLFERISSTYRGCRGVCNAFSELMSCVMMRIRFVVRTNHILRSLNLSDRSLSGHFYRYSVYGIRHTVESFRYLLVLRGCDRLE
jgi:hypothetical protein